MKHSETTQENVDKYCRMNGSAYVSDDRTLHIEVDIERHESVTIIVDQLK